MSIVSTALETKAVHYGHDFNKSELSRTPSVLFSREVQVNSYLTQLCTVVAQCPHTVYCHILAMYIGAALYRTSARLINCTAFNVLITLKTSFKKYKALIFLCENNQ